MELSEMAMIFVTFMFVASWIYVAKLSWRA